MDKKVCEDCGCEFVDNGTGRCPKCGSTDLDAVEFVCKTPQGAKYD